MSGKLKQRHSANAVESATVSLNERILKECHSLYTDGEKGLIRIASNVNISLLAPRKKITVLLTGNHSAGKSSFINWYIEEHVQRTGVAIETQGFTLITSGRKRESLTGNATLHLYPHFEPLRNIEGVTDYLATEISSSKQKKFSLVTFVDTPGLVDGDMMYPFDVNKAIEWLGDLADRIYVFFDPIGQALCKRTLNLVEALSAKHADRMRFYLSKADEAGHESDRQRVMMQIVQELCRRPSLNRTGFDMPTIYIPDPNRKSTRCVNQIEEVCKDIEKTINLTIQSTLNTLEKDCDQVIAEIDNKITEDNLKSSLNSTACRKGFLFYLLSFLLCLVTFSSFLTSSVLEELIDTIIGKNNSQVYLSFLSSIWKSIPADYYWYIIGGCLLLVLIFFAMGKSTSRSRPTLTNKQRQLLTDQRAYVCDVLKPKKQKLYQEYLKQSVADQDL